MRPVTLDQGIAVIDETKDGNGSVGNPNDAQVDDFYRRALVGFNNITEIDYKTTPVNTLNDFGIYNTIIWHTDDSNEQLTINNYTDTHWGVLTGPDTETMLEIINTKEPLLIKSVLSGTKLNL